MVIFSVSMMCRYRNIIKKFCYDLPNLFLINYLLILLHNLKETYRKIIDIRRMGFWMPYQLLWMWEYASTCVVETALAFWEFISHG